MRAGSVRPSRRLLVAVGVVCLALGAAGIVFRMFDGSRGPGRVLQPSAPVEMEARASEPATLQQAESTTGAGNTATSAEERAPAATKPAPPRSTATRGRVLDLRGTGVVGVRLTSARTPRSHFATSSANGTFELESAPEELVSNSPEWLVVRQSETYDRGAGNEMFVLVAPTLELGGIVVDEANLGLAGAQVCLVLPDAAFKSFPEPLDRALPAPPYATGADETGRFTLAAPAIEGARMEAALTGYGREVQAAPREARTNLVIVLRRASREAAQRGPRIQGRVVHHDGTPGVGAQVSYMNARALAAESGHFELEMPTSVEDALPLVATKHGFQSAVMESFAKHFNVMSPTEFVLTLGPPPLSITGRVVDAEDKPLAGWTVQLVDGTTIQDSIPPVTAESLTFGSALVFVTQADGAFALEGLLDRTYRLQAHSAAELLRVEAGPFAAGARDVRIAVPADARIPRVTGRVVGLDGSPIEHVRVSVRLDVLKSGSSTSHERSAAVTTDAEGRFELVNLPRANGAIDVSGETILPESFDYTRIDVAQPLILQVERRCHFRVEGLTDETGVTGFSLADASGSTVAIWTFQAGLWSRANSYSRAEVATAQLAASEVARTIHFRGANNEELGARALRLIAGEVTVVRY